MNPVLYVLGGLVLLLGLSQMQSCSRGKDIAALNEQVRRVETERDAHKVAVEGHQRTIKAWEEADKLTRDALADLHILYSECSATKNAQAEDAAAARARLDAELRDANATLAAITTRFKAATRDPECAVCIDRPVCAALRSVK